MSQTLESTPGSPDSSVPLKDREITLLGLTENGSQSGILRLSRPSNTRDKDLSGVPVKLPGPARWGLRPDTFRGIHEFDSMLFIKSQSRSNGHSESKSQSESDSQSGLWVWPIIQFRPSWPADVPPAAVTDESLAGLWLEIARKQGGDSSFAQRWEEELEKSGSEGAAAQRGGSGPTWCGEIPGGKENVEFV
ncbi:hypothetical protein Q5752_005902 [Cryptotrichosporon argae]